MTKRTRLVLAPADAFRALRVEAVDEVLEKVPDATIAGWLDEIGCSPSEWEVGSTTGIVADPQSNSPERVCGVAAYARNMTTEAFVEPTIHGPKGRQLSDKPLWAHSDDFWFQTIAGVEYVLGENYAMVTLHVLQRAGLLPQV